MDGIPSSIDWSGVREVIARAERDGAVIGAAIRAPSGEPFRHNASRRFVAASTVKVPLMIALFREIDAGRRGLSDPYRLANADRALGSGVMLHLHEGIEFTLGDLVYLMISISDNTATNVLIDLVGMPAVNAVMRDLGMAGSSLERKMQGRAAEPGAAENWAVPEEYAAMLAALLGNRVAAPASCAAMITYLEKQQNERRIARFLPREEKPRWGSKTGSVPGVVNDVGFIETAHGMLILSIFCEKIDPHSGEEVIGEISRAALAALG
ncbi:MAG: class A beta-lactamase-related serine hydrolase [Rhodospirillales bacterium]|nr:class A beta-lactamase-related serine hydrolase [Rhodospirillales bacterium]